MCSPLLAAQCGGSTARLIPTSVPGSHSTAQHFTPSAPSGAGTVAAMVGLELVEGWSCARRDRRSTAQGETAGREGAR